MARYSAAGNTVSLVPDLCQRPVPVHPTGNGWLLATSLTSVALFRNWCVLNMWAQWAAKLRRNTLYFGHFADVSAHVTLHPAIPFISHRWQKCLTPIDLFKINEDCVGSAPLRRPVLAALHIHPHTFPHPPSLPSVLFYLHAVLCLCFIFSCGEIFWEEQHINLLYKCPTKLWKAAVMDSEMRM